MVLETYEAFTAYLEALPANVDRLDAAAKAVSAAAQVWLSPASLTAMTAPANGGSNALIIDSYPPSMRG